MAVAESRLAPADDWQDCSTVRTLPMRRRGDPRVTALLVTFLLGCCGSRYGNNAHPIYFEIMNLILSGVSVVVGTARIRTVWVAGRGPLY